MAQIQTMPSAAFEHERCKPNAACAQKAIPVMAHVVTDEDIGLVQVCCVVLEDAILCCLYEYINVYSYGMARRTLQIRVELHIRRPLQSQQNLP